jgi:hypothetical protein
LAISGFCNAAGCAFAKESGQPMNRGELFVAWYIEFVVVIRTSSIG